MKKALEAGIEFCNKNINYKPNPADYREDLDDTVWEDYLRSYIAIHHVLKAMLKALDAEPEKPDLDKIKNSPQTILCRQPEPQGSVVDWEAVCRVIDSTGIERTYANAVWCALNEKKSQWLKTKPAIDPEIKDKYYELLYSVGSKFEGETRHETALRYIKRAEGDGIDPEIKRVYEEISCTPYVRKPENYDMMWNCIKAHCERGE
jgi:hypothetical protein